LLASKSLPNALQTNLLATRPVGRVAPLYFFIEF